VELCGAVNQSGSNATGQVASGDRQVSNRSGHSPAGQFGCQDASQWALPAGEFVARTRPEGAWIEWYPGVHAPTEFSHGLDPYRTFGRKIKETLLEKLRTLAKRRKTESDSTGRK
jgi:hypothetical protein